MPILLGAVRGVKRTNCLTKNLLEMESLPQIRNLLEMSEISSAAKVSGGVKDEVNDEERKRIAEATAGRYRRARKKRKTGTLNEFVEPTGFSRGYAGVG